MVGEKLKGGEQSLSLEQRAAAEKQMGEVIQNVMNMIKEREKQAAEIKDRMRQREEQVADSDSMLSVADQLEQNRDEKELDQLQAEIDALEENFGVGGSGDDAASTSSAAPESDETAPSETDEAAASESGPSAAPVKSAAEVERDRLILEAVKSGNFDWTKMKELQSQIDEERIARGEPTDEELVAREEDRIEREQIGADLKEIKAEGRRIETAERREREAAAERAKRAEAEKTARGEILKEVAWALRDTHTGKTRSLDDAISYYDRGIKKLEEEMKGLKWGELEEARGDLGSMQQRLDLLLELKNAGNASDDFKELAKGGMKLFESNGELSTEYKELEKGNVVVQAAGGELGDNNPLENGRRDAANILADPERLVQWREAERLYDKQAGVNSILKAVFLKERQELEDSGMSRDAAEDWIKRERGISEELLGKLKEDTNSDEDVEYYIGLGYDALNSGRNAAREVRGGETYEDVSEKFLAPRNKKLHALYEKMNNYMAHLNRLEDMLNNDKLIDEQRQELNNALNVQKSRVRDLRREIEILRAEIEGIRSVGYGLPHKDSGFSQIEYKYDESKAEEDIADMERRAAEINNREKKNVFERLKEKLNKPGAGKRIARRIASAAAALLLTFGLGAYTIRAMTQTAYAEGLPPEEPAVTEAGDYQSETELPGGIEVDLGQDGEESEMEKTGVKIEDIELNQNYEVLANGVFANYDEYNGYGNRANKVTNNAFGMDKSYLFENKDVNEAANAMYKLAHEQPEVLASFVANFPPLLKECGLDPNLTAPEIDKLISNTEEGGKIQKKLLEAFKRLLESGDTTIEFSLAIGNVSTSWLERDDKNDGTGHALMENDEKTRENEPQIKLSWTTMEDGVRVTYVMYVNLQCGFQPNKFMTYEGTAPDGTPERVVLVIPGHPEDFPEPELPPEVEDEEPELPPDTPETTPETPESTPDTPETPPDTPETPPDTPETPPVDPPVIPPVDPPVDPPVEGDEVRLKSAESLTERANIDGTGTVTQTEAVSQSQLENERPGAVGGDQDKKGGGAVVDTTVDAEQQQINNAVQGAADAEADQAVRDANANGGQYIGNNELDALMDYFNGVTNGSEQGVKSNDGNGAAQS